MPTLPPDLQEVLDQIDDSDRAADLLIADLSDAQFHWQPEEGRAWSIAQCLEHLGRINREYIGAVRAGVDLARQRGWRRTGPIASTFIGRWFIKSMEPPVTRRLAAPSKARPGSTATRAEIMTLYHASHEQVRQIIAACSDLDVNRARFGNPFIGIVRVRVGTGLRVIAAHDRRHLWQAEHVRRGPGFPAR